MIKVIKTILIMPLVIVGGIIAGVMLALFTTLFYPLDLIVSVVNDIWED